MKGLTTAQADAKRAVCGTNALALARRAHPLRIFCGQFKDAMVLILLVATAISAVLGAFTDALTIAAIVLLNAILGFVQEFRTERTLLALQKMAAPMAHVWRDDALISLPTSELVPEDVIHLESGDCVPADALLLTGANVWAEESLLTGESLPVEKVVAAEGAATDSVMGRADLLYAGTFLTRGTAEARVVAIGQATQMGQISKLLVDIEQGLTPLQKRLAELGRVVGLICLAVCGLVFFAGLLRGEPLFAMLMTGITIAIAAIPEGLPATVTIALALAVRKMLKRNALVHRLHAVETLGCASVICSDKTGTITENKMTVRRMATAADDFTLSGNGWEKAGALACGGAPCNPRAKPDLLPLLRCAVLCNHAQIRGNDKTDTAQSLWTKERGRLTQTGIWQTTGDPTEIALLVAAAKCQVSADGFSRFSVISEIPFASETRMMTVVLQAEAGRRLICRKGAVDVVLADCAFALENGQPIPLTPAKRRAIVEQAEAWSEEALRVLAFAEKSCDAGEGTFGGMVFLGLTGMLDPPRIQAKKAIADCTRAGVRVVMLTGDHAKTAAAIARQAGIPKGGRVLTGAALDALSDAELTEKIDDYGVFARVTPAHKLRLVRAYRAKGRVVTMTGDGVNDAPAVKEADIGVAMGKNGTDVTRQAADVILLDDRLDTLVAAVEQGRTVYANIRKFVRYLLACNIGEVLTMFVGILMGLPMVLLPTQILLVNLVTDGLPAIALGLEPPGRSTMRRPPRGAAESFFANGLLSKIIFRGILIALSTLGSFTTILRLSQSVEMARTAALVTLVLSQLLHVFECKSEHGTLLTVPYGSNGKLLLAVAISLGVLGAALWVAPLRALFQTTLLAGSALWIACAFSFAVPVAAALPLLWGGSGRDGGGE